MGIDDILGSLSKQLEQQLDVGSSGARGPAESRGSSGPAGGDPFSPAGRGEDRSRTDLTRVIGAVVQVVALRKGFLGSMSSAWTGSGTIVDPSGLVLTSCQVASPSDMGIDSPRADRLAIALAERPDSPPAICFYAEVAALDARLDLAVLRIVADDRGRPVRGLRLPSLPMGDSNDLREGDRLTIVGYPGIGGETVTPTVGHVTDFGGQADSGSPRAWIRTDAIIAGGSSGGAAIDHEGRLVGVPTQTPGSASGESHSIFGRRSPPMDVGGMINLLRPVNLAWPLLEKCGMRLEKESPGWVGPGGPVFPTGGSTAWPQQDQAGFRELHFCAQVTDDGRPIHPTERIPAGVPAVYATFHYDGMRDGTPWSIVWTTGGRRIVDQQDRWDEGPEGRKAVKISNRKGVPAGEYHLVLAIEGATALEGKVTVGAVADERDSEISGRLVDGQTASPISRGTVIVLRPGVSLNQFMRTQDRAQILTSAETGSDGRFTLPDQLPKGHAYSLIAAAVGYKAVAVEGALRVGNTAPEHADIGNIELTRGF